eukprot:584744-Rhodomonas_salina.2
MPSVPAVHPLIHSTNLASSYTQYYPPPQYPVLPRFPQYRTHARHNPTTEPPAHPVLPSACALQNKPGTALQTKLARESAGNVNFLELFRAIRGPECAGAEGDAAGRAEGGGGG